MRELFLVGAGGFLGSILRYGMQGGIYRFVEKPWIPWGTLAVNILGCFIIGWLGEMADTRSVIGPQARLFLFIGVLGGFTTFSTFGYETVALWRSGEWLPAVANAGMHMVFCLGAVGLGAVTSRLW